MVQGTLSGDPPALTAGLVALHEHCKPGVLTRLRLSPSGFAGELARQQGGKCRSTKHKPASCATTLTEGWATGAGKTSDREATRCFPPGNAGMRRLPGTNAVRDRSHGDGPQRRTDGNRGRDSEERLPVGAVPTS